jgi:hypothetical protein
LKQGKYIWETNTIEANEITFNAPKYPTWNFKMIDSFSSLEDNNVRIESLGNDIYSNPLKSLL